LVLVLPGYALVAALFPRRSLAAPERLLFIIGLSLTVSVLGGLVLNFTPWGIGPNSWAVFLTCITAASGAVGVARRTVQGVDAEDRQPWHQGMTADELRGPLWGAKPRTGLLFGLAALLATGALGVARFGATQQPGPEFTQLWIVPANSGSQYAVRVGVRSFEHTPTNYRLQVKLNGGVVRQWPSIVLKPEQTWEVDLILAPGCGSCPPNTQAIEAVLYRADRPDVVYRSARLEAPASGYPSLQVQEPALSAVTGSRLG
jgi:uncharacterized membrane protein